MEIILENEKTLQIKLKKQISVIMVLFLILFIAVIFSIKVGTMTFSIREIIDSFGKSAENEISGQLIKNIRMPRILLGMLVGMNLAVAGVLLQGVLRNPMASPNIIGVNAGAGLAAVIIMIVFPVRMEFLSLSTSIGAFVTSLIIYGVSYFSGNKNVNLILAGVAISALFSSLTSGLMVLNSDNLNLTYNWLIGSFSGKSWTEFKNIYPYSLIGLSLAFFVSPKMNIFMLGEEMAETMGVSVKKYKIFIILISSLLAGSAVSISGTIGFIGLISPHMGRILVGNNHKFLIPTTALLGALLVILSDTVARTMFSPFELPVGIIIAILGAPFFLYLLFSKNIINK